MPASNPNVSSDASVHVKRLNTPDCDAPIAPLVSLNALPDDWKIFPWNKFSGFTISERAGQTSWIWQHGFDIQARDSPSTRKWVCRPCLQKLKPKISDFSAVGKQNIEKHLFRDKDVGTVSRIAVLPKVSSSWGLLPTPRSLFFSSNMNAQQIIRNTQSGISTKFTSEISPFQ